jgi:hypothetical protein
MRLVAGFPPRRPGFKPGSGHVGFCDGQKCHWGRFAPSTSVSLANHHSMNLSIIIITLVWHNGDRGAEWTQLDSTLHCTNFKKIILIIYLVYYLKYI